MLGSKSCSERSEKVGGLLDRATERDGRPIISRKDLQQMGYVGCIEAQVTLCTEFHFLKKALTELRKTGDYTGMTNADYVAARQAVEDIIGLDEYYEIEAKTVEARQPKDQASG